MIKNDQKSITSSNLVPRWSPEAPRLPRLETEQLSKWQVFDVYGNVNVRCFFCAIRLHDGELQVDCFTKGLEEDKDKNKLYYVCPSCVGLYERVKELGHKTMQSTFKKMCIMCKNCILVMTTNCDTSLHRLSSARILHARRCSAILTKGQTKK